MAASQVVFRAMADRTRQRALAALCPYELTVSELVEVLDQPQSTVSRHLKVLRDAGLIRDRREGNTVFYSVPTRAAGGGDADLPGRLLEWVAEQPIERTIGSRLEAVIDRRRDMSSRFFDRIGRQWDALREESFGAKFHLEASLALLPESWVVADVGTGTGYLLPTIARYFKRIIAVDPVERMLEAARHRVEYHRLDNVELKRGDLARLPIPEAAVELAVAVLVLHHVPTPRDALAELHRILRDRGRVLIVEQTAHDNEAFRDRMQDRWWGFVPTEFCSLLKSVGFEEVRSRALLNVERAADAPDLFVVTGRKVT